MENKEKMTALNNSADESVAEIVLARAKQPANDGSARFIRRSRTSGKREFTPEGDRATARLSGCNSTELGAVFAAQARVPITENASIDKQLDLEAAYAFLNSIGPPADALEAAMATQLYTLHTTAMRFLNKASLAEDSPLADLYMNRADKALRNFAQILAAYNRHRGRGQQMMRIEHIHVNGGEAIVGVVNATKTNQQ